MPDAQVHNIFPTPLWIVDFDPQIFQPLNERLKTTLYDMIGPRPEIAPGGRVAQHNPALWSQERDQ